MSVKGKNGARIEYQSRRLQQPKPAEFAGSYGPSSEVFNAKPGSIDHFLVERYCLYAVRGKSIWRTNIHHLPWPLQYAFAEVENNSVAQAHGIELPNRTPVLHFAREIDVFIWAPENLQSADAPSAQKQKQLLR